MTDAVVAFEPPGPGAWTRSTAHFGRPLTRMLQEVHPRGVDLGIRRFAAAYGAPLAGQSSGFVHGFGYGQVRVNADPSAMTACVEAATEAAATRRWRADARRWHEHQKPALIAANLALQDVALGALSDESLVAHVERVVEHCVQSSALHFELHGADQLPVGELLLACARWGIPDGAAADALAGSSPSSLSATAELVTVASVLRAERKPFDTLDDVRSAAEAAAVALDRHLRLHGWRLATSYDIDSPTVGELPALTLHVIRQLLTRGVSGGRRDDPADALRAKVPAAARDAFDELLADACTAYGLRDDHVGIDTFWPLGLLRRALLEVGARLTDRRLGVDPQHAVELASDEVAAALAGSGPSAMELAARRAQRERLALVDAPRQLGEASDEAPELPPPVARFAAAFAAATGRWFEPPTRPPLHGDGIGDASYVGRACVATDASTDLDRLAAGDVLVVRFATPAFNGAIAAAGALVTAEGGLFCHAAIAARELAIPAVVGVPAADRMIPDGARVRVDAASGTVHLLR